MTNAVSLGDIAVFIRNGVSIKQSDRASGLPITRIETIAKWSVNLNKCGYADVSEGQHDEYLLKDGDILVSHINSTKHLGKCALYKIRERKVIHGMNLLNMRLKPDVAYSEYVYRALSSDHFRRKIPRITKNSVNQSSFTVTNFKDLTIPLPPLKEQKRIAAILDKADAIRRKRQQAIALADEFLRSVFLDMFGDPVSNPMGWETKNLADIGAVVTGNTPSRKKPEYYGDHIEWIKSDNINTPNHYLTTAEEYLSEEGLKVARTAPRDSLLVTCIAGSKDCIGNIAIADRTVSFNQQINALVLKPEAEVLFIYAQILYNKSLIQAASTNSMKGMVSKSKFSNVRLIFPSADLQIRYAKIFEKAMNWVGNSKSSLSEAERLLASLTQNVFKVTQKSEEAA